jgi:hypothetical protein
VPIVLKQRGAPLALLIEASLVALPLTTLVFVAGVKMPSCTKASTTIVKHGAVLDTITVVAHGQW